MTSARVRSWYAALARSTSATPPRQAYALVCTMLNTAVDDEILLRNPCRIRDAGVARAAERPIATLAQVEALAEAVYPRYRALVLLAAWTGVRWGELIALTHDRIDLVAGQVRFDRQYVLLKAEGDQPARVVLQSPKTDAVQAAEWPLWIEPLDDGPPPRELRLGFDTDARLLETVVLIFEDGCQTGRTTTRNGSPSLVCRTRNASFA